MAQRSNGTTAGLGYLEVGCTNSPQAVNLWPHFHTVVYRQTDYNNGVTYAGCWQTFRYWSVRATVAWGIGSSPAWGWLGNFSTDFNLKDPN